MTKSKNNECKSSIGKNDPQGLKRVLNAKLGVAMTVTFLVVILHYTLNIIYSW